MMSNPRRSYPPKLATITLRTQLIRVSTHTIDRVQSRLTEHGRKRVAQVLMEAEQSISEVLKTEMRLSGAIKEYHDQEPKTHKLDVTA